MLDKDILFIFGAPRSGTTYTKNLLRDYFDIGLYGECQWLLPFGQRVSSYGDLTDDTNLQRLIDDIREDSMFEHFRTVYAKKQGRALDVTSENIWANLPERSYPGVVYSVFASFAQQLEKTHIGNKFPGYWQDLPALRAWFPKAKFLHIVRDGRDVALSLKQRVWGQKTAYGAARMWVEIQELAHRFKSTMPANQYYTMQYEQLLQEPEETIGKLESYLEIPLEDSTRSELTNEIIQSPMRNNFGKWRQAMPLSEQRNFEAVGGKWLRQLGYETVLEDPQVTWVDRAMSCGRETFGKAKLTLLSMGSKRPLD